MNKFSKHFAFILNTYGILAVDEATESVLFVAEDEICCEISGMEFSCSTKQEFHELVEMFGEKIH